MFGLVFPCLNIACLYVLVESVGFGWLAWMLGLGLSKRCSSRLSWVQIWNTDNNPWNAFWQPLNKHHTESAWKWRKTFYTRRRWHGTLRPIWPRFFGTWHGIYVSILLCFFLHMTWELCADLTGRYFSILLTDDMGISDPSYTWHGTSRNTHLQILFLCVERCNNPNAISSELCSVPRTAAPTVSDLTGKCWYAASKDVAKSWLEIPRSS